MGSLYKTTTHSTHTQHYRTGNMKILLIISMIVLSVTGLPQIISKRPVGGGFSSGIISKRPVGGGFGSGIITKTPVGFGGGFGSGIISKRPVSVGFDRFGSGFGGGYSGGYNGGFGGGFGAPSQVVLGSGSIFDPIRTRPITRPS